MEEVNILKEENKENESLIEQNLKKLSKDELIIKFIKLSEEKKNQEDFILNISHDLRSPLNVIFSALQCYKNDYKDSKNNVKYKEHMDIIKRNSYKILKLVNNLIDTTKLQKNYYTIKKENLDIINLIECNIASIDKYAKQKDISLVFDTNVEECIMAVDPEALDRILMNLISNAIKFSPKQSNIYINAWKSIKQLTISIKDEGIGISKEEQGTIFDRFVQSSKNKSKSIYNSGSGIGLDLVRCLTKAHNGSIELKSEENKGCEFIIKLPIEKVDNQIKKIECLNTKSKVEILEVEFSDIYL